MGAGDKNVPTIALVGPSETTITLPDDSNVFNVTCLTSAGANSTCSISYVYGGTVMEGRLVTFIVQSQSQTVTFLDSGVTTTNGLMNLNFVNRDVIGGNSITIRQNGDGSWIINSTSF